MTGIKNGAGKFQRLTGSNYSLWGTNPDFSDVVQGAANTCYLMSSLAAVAEIPLLAKDLILNQQINKYGIYAIRLFVRGKPWIITIDDQFYHENGRLKFAQAGEDSSIWGALIEKAWAKLKGSYLSANLGYVSSGLRALVGIPVFDYDVSTTEGAWELLKAADESAFLTVAITG